MEADTKKAAGDYARLRALLGLRRGLTADKDKRMRAARIPVYRALAAARQDLFPWKETGR